MTHKPAIPAAGTPPYPTHPAPQVHEATQAPVTKEPSSDNTQRNVSILGTAVGIGSAAIVAALLYAGRRRG